MTDNNIKRMQFITKRSPRVKRTWSEKSLNWYIQVRPCTPRTSKIGSIDLIWVAWASNLPSDDPMKAPGDVYFEFGDTENDAVNKLKKELKAIARETNPGPLKKAAAYIDAIQNAQPVITIDNAPANKEMGQVRIDNELFIISRVRDVIVDGKFIKRMFIKWRNRHAS